MLRNRIAYVLVFFVLILFLFIHESRMTYTAVYTALILPVFSLILMYLSKNRIRITENLSQDFVPKGYATTLRVFIRNLHFIPIVSAQIDFKVDDMCLEVEPSTLPFSVKTLGRRNLEIRINGIYRGVYEVGTAHITLHDFLGLFRYRYVQDKRLMLTITPRILPITDLFIDSVIQESLFSKNLRQSQDYNIVSELRQYQPTDGYKRVHWKASAKRGELISKNFQETEKSATTFFIDNSHENYKGDGARRKALIREDAIMEAVVSVMYYCHGLGHPISVQSLSESKEDFTTDFHSLYKETSMLTFVKGGDFNAILDNYSKEKHDPMNLFIFTKKLNRTLLSTLKVLDLSDNHIVVFLFEKIEDNVLKDLEKLNIQCVLFDEIILHHE